MTSAYSLVGLGESSIEVEVIVGKYEDNDIEVEVTPRVIENSDKEVEFYVTYTGNSEIEVEVQPVIFSEIEVEVEVNPHNRMTATYYLTEAPTETVTEYPVQDSYVIQKDPYSSINYGANNSMVTGVDDKGENIAFVQFDLSNVSHNIRIKNAKLRLYYSRLTDILIETYRVDIPWSEMGITYLNMPSEYRFITNEYEDNPIDRYIDIDVTQVVEGWILGLPNNGFSIKSNDSPTTIFRTRQTATPPNLIIEHYSEFPPTPSQSSIDVDVTCVQSDVSEIEVDLEVISNYDNDYIEVEVTCHNTNDVINDDKIVEFWVTRKEVEVEVEVFHTDKSEIEVEVSCVIDDISDIEVEVEVPIFDDISEIEVDVTCSIVDSSEIEVEVDVPLYEDNSSIEVEVTCVQSDVSEIEVVIEAIRTPKIDFSEVLVEVDSIGIYKADISEVEVEVDVWKDYKYSESEIEVYVGVPSYTESEIEVEVYVTRSEFEVEVTVPYVSYSEIEVDVQARVLYISDIEVEVTVGKTDAESQSYIYII